MLDISQIRKLGGWRRTLALAGVAGATATMACSCSSSNGNAAEHAAQNTDTSLQEQNQPLPIFPTSAMRGELIQIEAIEALGSPTTTFFFPPGASSATGSAPIKTCASEGEPIPNTASLSNPHQVVSAPNSQSGVIDQEDPNGTYAPTASSGTFVLCDTPGGGVKLVYWEGDVFAESGTAVWNTTTHQIDDVGPSQLPSCEVAVSNGHDGTGLNANTRYYHCTKA